MVLWKRLNTESDPKKRNLPKMNFFEVFPVFSKIIWNPSNPILRGISRFCYPFPWFLGQIPVYQGLILLRDFPIFLRDFPNTSCFSTYYFTYCGVFIAIKIFNWLSICQRSGGRQAAMSVHYFPFRATY